MSEEAFYDLVATEIQQGQLKPGLWTKAFADANGDQTKARVLYIRQRVAQLEQEAVQAARLQREQQKEQARQAAQKLADEEWERLYPKDKPTDIRAHVITVAAILLTILLLWLVTASK